MRQCLRSCASITQSLSISVDAHASFEELKLRNMAKRHYQPLREPRPLKKRTEAFIIALFGVLLVVVGVSMHLRNDVDIGIDPRTLQPKIITGPFVALIGILLLVFAWFMWRKKTK